jgi:predicted dehydrogenase
MAPVRFGLIGAGRWGQVYLRTLAALEPRCQVTHVASSRLDAAASYGRPVVVTPDWRAVIRAGCDAVIIATPPAAHAGMLRACLEARVPCIVEKPFCMDPGEADELAARVEEAALPVLVDHTAIFHPAYQALKSLLKERGEPVQFLLTEGMGFGPFRPDVPALWDWGPHDVSLCVDLLGAGPDHVEAAAGPEGASGDPEMVLLRLDFPQGGTAWVHIGRLSPVKRRSLTVGTRTMLYHLDEFSVDALKAAPRSGQIAGAGPAWETLIHAPVTPPLTAMLTYFLDGLAGGDRSRFGTALSLEVVRVLAAAAAGLKIAARRSSATLS